LHLTRIVLKSSNGSCDSKGWIWLHLTRIVLK